MNVSSPVGTFSFEVEGASLGPGGLVVHGRMGTWPTQITVQGRDVLHLGRVFARPLIVGAGGVAASVAVLRMLGTGRRLR